MIRVEPGGIAFALLAALTVGSAGVVAFARNVIHSAFALLGTLAGVAGLYALLAADFLATVQVLVYVGGTALLVLFAVMLTSNIDRAATSNLPRPRKAAAFVCGLLAIALSVVASNTVWPSRPTADVPSTARLGHALLGPYVLPFEVASVLLLAALVGALLLARRAVRTGGDE